MQSICDDLEIHLVTLGASKNAEGLFQDVLGRKDDADRTRNALNVLQRFRFLFSLPQCIEKNIQQVFRVRILFISLEKLVRIPFVGQILNN